MPTLPPTERTAMARLIAVSRVSSVLSGVGRGQRAGVAVCSAATIPARTSGGRLAHDATRRARSASGGAWSPPAFGRDVGGTGPPVGPPVRPRPAPRLAPGAARAAPGAARSSESAYSPGDSASARGFDSPRLHFFVSRVFAAGLRKSAETGGNERKFARLLRPPTCRDNSAFMSHFRDFPLFADGCRCALRCAQVFGSIASCRRTTPGADGTDRAELPHFHRFEVQRLTPARRRRSRQRRPRPRHRARPPTPARTTHPARRWRSAYR